MNPDRLPMQKSEKGLEIILHRLDEIVNHIQTTLSSVKDTDGLMIGEQIEVLYDEKQKVIESLMAFAETQSAEWAAEEKEYIQTRLRDILQKEAVNLQAMEMYTNLLAHKLRQLQRQKSLRVYRGER